MDEAALAELYQLHVRRIYAFALARVGTAADAEEVTSATFMTMLKVIHRYQGENPTAFAAWLIKIARSRIADHYRHLVRRPVTHLDDLPPATVAALSSPGDAIQSLCEWDRLAGALNQLTREQQELIVLKFVAGYDNRTLARLTGRNPAAVNAMQYRALRSLRRLLQTPAQAEPVSA
ncbi:MAG: RNA polymerase sigma factor [Candidatus Dormibacteria bacterium]